MAEGAVNQADRIRRQVMSTTEAERVAKEYDTLLAVADAARFAVAGLPLAWVQDVAFKDMCVAVARLDAVR